MFESYMGVIMIGTLITNFGRCYQKHSLDGTGRSTKKVLLLCSFSSYRSGIYIKINVMKKAIS